MEIIQHFLALLVKIFKIQVDLIFFNVKILKRPYLKKISMIQKILKLMLVLKKLILMSVMEQDLF